MKYEEIVRFKNSKEWIEFNNYYKDLGVTEQLGLYRYEDVSTNFLATLLNNNNSYGYDIEPMKLFLELIKIKSEKNNYFSSLDLLKDYKITDLSVELRKKLPSGFPDLYITFNIKQGDKEMIQYLILLEAKLQSDEHDKQTTNYYNDLLHELPNTRKIFLYLTLDGKKCGCSEYEKITYQDLIDYVYTPLTFIESNNITLTVKEYLKTFNALYYHGVFDKDDIIPMSYEGKILSLKLWERFENSFKGIFTKEVTEDNKKLFTDFYNCNKEMLKVFFINIDKLVKEGSIIENKNNEILFDAVSRIAGNIKECNKIDNEYCNDAQFVYKVFSKIITDFKEQKKRDITYEDLEDINKSINGYKYIYTKDEYAELKHYRQCYDTDKYGELIIEGEKYYYCTANRDIEIIKLIDNINSDERFSTYKDNKTFERVDKIFWL